MPADSQVIPRDIAKFVSSLPETAVALVGCRALGRSLDCCEYDLAVFSKKSPNQVVRLAKDTVELLYFEGEPARYATDLYGMRVIKDAKFTLASSLHEITNDTFRKALVAQGRKLLVSSLFCQRKAAQQKDVTSKSMWGKIAAYRFVAGAVALSGSRPMPLHELEQTREIDAHGVEADGIQAALECIGIERATRPAISRSASALREIKSNDYDVDLVTNKIEFLLAGKKLSDCYYFIGRSASENLAGRGESFHRRYGKLVQLALDLTNDTQQLVRPLRTMHAAAGAMLGG